MNPTPPAPSLTPDQSAAHYFLSELRTRISTQPLPYQYGVESRALESLWEVFGQAREAMKKYPGCKQFSDKVTRTLNIDLRPVTAKWHKAHEEGRLASHDGADEFRGDLELVQQKLRSFADELHRMAYGEPFKDDLSPSALSESELNMCFEDVPFGISKGVPGVADETIDAMNKDESDDVAARRKNSAIDETETAAGHNAVGLSLSGGGIRSATFCLGVVQALAERGFLKQIDFLSTVSGGGYTGAFITTRLGDGVSEKELARPHGPDPSTIHYLRLRAKYLSPLNIKEAWSNVTATLAGMVLNWTAPLFIIVFAALLAVLLKDRFREFNVWGVLIIVFSILTTISLLLYCWLMRLGRKTAKFAGSLLASCLAFTLLFVAGWLLDKGYDALPDWITRHWAFSGGLGALVAAAPAILRFIPVLQKPSIRKIVLQIILFLAGLIVPLLALALFYVCWHLGSAPSAFGTKLDGWIFLALAAGLFAFIAILLLNINLTAPHRLYRDSLARTFVQKEDDQNALRPFTSINEKHTAPYHLLNAALNIPSSEHPALRDRKCDFFIFSKHWSGSPATNYHKTSQWKMNGEISDLATAMAISGAAASSYMGLGTMPTLTALLAFLNVRLGFWIRNPHRREGLQSPGFLCLLREMTGSGMSEKQRWLNLSDGGHIENLGLYELLRRRCKFIICVDGEADPAFTFQGFMTATRHAQIDFGIRIDSKLDELRAEPATGRTQTHARLCRIHYPAVTGADNKPPATGLLLYLKSSITGNESELIKRYRIMNPDFPHQSTLDQFFDQEQFEAYRQLGVHVAEGLFAPALMNNKGFPATIPDWFRRLARNLLEPKI